MDDTKRPDEAQPAKDATSSDQSSQIAPGGAYPAAPYPQGQSAPGTQPSGYGDHERPTQGYPPYGYGQYGQSGPGPTSYGQPTGAYQQGMSGSPGPAYPPGGYPPQYGNIPPYPPTVAPRRRGLPVWAWLIPLILVLLMGGALLGWAVLQGQENERKAQAASTATAVAGVTATKAEANWRATATTQARRTATAVQAIYVTATAQEQAWQTTLAEWTATVEAEWTATVEAEWTSTAVAESTRTAIAALTTTVSQSDNIKIVSSLPRTGLSKYQTDDIVEGMRIALEEHGGKAGSFSITYEDWDDATAQMGKWDPATEAFNAVKAVGDPDVMVYLGTFNSGAAKISIPILNNANIAMISPGNTAPELTKTGFDNATLFSLYPTGKRNYFRVTTADDVQAVAEANWATELGFKRAYIINDQETYGKGTAMVFEKQFKANGGTVINNEGIERNQPDYKTHMSKVKDSGADLLYFGGLIDTGGPQLIKDLKTVAPNIAFMGPDGIVSQYFIDAAGADVAEGTLASIAGRGYQDLPPNGVRFYNNFKVRMNREPDPYAVYGYEAMNIALDAIARAGKKDRTAILDAIAATRNYDGAFGVRSFDSNGDVTPNDISLYKVQGGKWVFQKYITVP